MADLSPLTPLGSADPKTDSFGGVTLREVVDVALASVTARLGHEAATAKLVAKLIGTPAPGPLQAAGKTRSAFWMGPDQWMIEASMETDDDIATQIAAQAKGTASVTEQSGGWCRFDLAGPRLAEVFALLCSADLRASTGFATRTAIDHLGCFVIKRDDARISVLGPRSSAGSLHHALLTAMHAAL